MFPAGLVQRLAGLFVEAGALIEGLAALLVLLAMFLAAVLPAFLGGGAGG